MLSENDNLKMDRFDTLFIEICSRFCRLSKKSTGLVERRLLRKGFYSILIHFQTVTNNRNH